MFGLSCGRGVRILHFFGRRKLQNVRQLFHTLYDGVRILCLSVAVGGEYKGNAGFFTGFMIHIRISDIDRCRKMVFFYEEADVFGLQKAGIRRTDAFGHIGLKACQSHAVVNVTGLAVADDQDRDLF